MQKMKIIFYLKKEKKNFAGQSAIYGKISVAGTNSTFSTGKYIDDARWKDTDHLRKIVKREEALKSYLKTIEEKADSVFLDYIKKDELVTAETIKAKLFGKQVDNDDKKTILQGIDAHNASFKKLVDKGEKSSGTLSRYNTVRRITAEFIKKEYGCEDLPLSSINKSFAFRFDEYLRINKKYRNKVGCGNNSTVKYIQNLKTMFNWLVRIGDWVDFNPLLAYDKTLDKVKTIYLDEEELEAIENTDFGCKRLNTVKDIFLFSCYTAYAPVDAMKLTWENVTLKKDGDRMINATRTKTDTEANLLLLPQAEKIINSFKDDPRCANENRLLPKLSNQKMNEYLKEIAKICGIKKKLTWYVSRHTFATTVMLGNDMPIEIISSAMGHTNIKQTQHYAKIREEKVKQHMKKLKNNYKK